MSSRPEAPCRVTVGSAGQVAPTTSVTESHWLYHPYLLPYVPPSPVPAALGPGAGAAPAFGSCELLAIGPSEWYQLPQEGSPVFADTPCCLERFPEQEGSPPDHSSPAPRGECSQEMSSASVKSDSERGRPPWHWTLCSTAAPDSAPKSSGDSSLPGSSLSSALVSLPSKVACAHPPQQEHP